MVTAMHLCRGNFRSTFQGAGGYDAIADILFNRTNIDAYFMEYDTERAGGFEPLRLVPKGKKVVLGLVTSKTGKLESKDEIKRRVEAATKYIDLDQLCLSPQCGFASTEEGQSAFRRRTVGQAWLRGRSCQGNLGTGLTRFSVGSNRCKPTRIESKRRTSEAWCGRQSW
jgi:methionine synthase II (cobalamin-independent)